MEQVIRVDGRFARLAPHNAIIGLLASTCPTVKIKADGHGFYVRDDSNECFIAYDVSGPYRAKCDAKYETPATPEMRKAASTVMAGASMFPCADASAPVVMGLRTGFFGKIGGSMAPVIDPVEAANCLLAEYLRNGVIYNDGPEWVGVVGDDSVVLGATLGAVRDYLVSNPLPSDW